MVQINKKEVERIFLLAPYIADLGLSLEEVLPGECHTSLIIKEKHLQQEGYVHAGVQASMADHTAGAAAASLVAPGRHVLTVEFKINFLRSAKGEILRCVARVLKAGRTLTVAESELFCLLDGQSRLVSKATVTLAVLGEGQEHPLPGPPY